METEKKEKHICEGYNKSKGYVGMFIDFTHGKSRRKCECKASIFENEKWYCKKHSPTKIKEREEKSWNNYIKKLR